MPREGYVSSTLASLIGQVLDGKVKILSLIGEGGMGTVYRGVQLNLERQVAVKVLKPQFVDAEDLVRRFYREAKLAGQLRSRHVVRIYDYGQVRDGAYIVMELSNGVALSTLLDQEAQLSQERAVLIAAQVLSGLGEAHAKGIIHRDLKTDNILVEKDFADRDFAILLDFGIARFDGSQSVQTATGSIFGTPSYMAPEQCRGEIADVRTDLYSLGVILYEMLAGLTPFGDRPPSQLLLAHIREQPPDIGLHRPDIAPRLGETVMKLLSKERDRRPRDADSTRRLLLTALDIPVSNEALGSFEETMPEEVFELDGELTIRPKR